MMKNIFLIVIFVACGFDTRAQSVFLKDGQLWEYAYFLNSRKVKMTYFLDGDTVIGGDHCMRLFVKSENPYYKKDYPYYKAALFEDGRKVYAILQGDTTPQLLYDFGLQRGDSVEVLSGGKEPAVLTIEEVLTVDVDGAQTEVLQYSIRQDFKGGGGYWIAGYGNNFPPNIEPVGGFMNYSYAWLHAKAIKSDVIECLRDALRKPRIAYQPMLSEGKFWMYKHHHFEDSDEEHVAKEEVYNIKYFLHGDTIIGGKIWHKMFSEDEYGNLSYRGAWFEENRKVWRIFPGELVEEMVFNFDMMKYEVCHQRNAKYWYFNDVDTVEVNGQCYVRHNYLDMDLYDIHGFCNVEGIGGPEGILPFPQILPTCRCDYSTFLGVYENDKCIFSPEDFGKERYTDGIGLLVDDESSMVRHDGGVYDLQGRQVSDKKNVNSGQLPRGIYIQNGRKFVVK